MSVDRLAIDGGPKALPEGPPDWPPDDPAIREAVASALADRSWGRYRGPHCDRLAERIAAYHGLDHVTLCCSGTIAVELALRGLKVGPGDEVILAGYDFAGNLASIEAIGATPVLVDVDPLSFQLDPARLEEATSPATKAIIASHLHGGIVRIRETRELAASLGIAVVEDACQCPGATIEGRPAGSWGDVSVLSFGGSKLLTAGRGGAVLTRDPGIQQRIRLFSERGNQAFPLSEIQAATLLPQWDRLDERNAIRTANVARLLAGLSSVECLRPFARQVADARPAYYKLGFEYVAAETDGRSRADFVRAIQAEGVALDAGFRDFSRKSPRRVRRPTPVENSRQAGESVVVLHHPVLLESAETIDRVVRAIEKVAETWQSQQ